MTIKHNDDNGKTKKKVVLDDQRNTVVATVGVKRSEDPKGSIGYKAVRDARGKPCLALLIIPENATVYGSMANVGKLRTRKVYVKAICPIITNLFVPRRQKH